MMSIIIARFWPVLIPLALYIFWHELRKRKARKAGEKAAKFHEGPWLMTLSAALVIGVLCMLWYGALAEKNTEVRYTPPYVAEDGSVVHGEFAPLETDQ